MDISLLLAQVFGIYFVVGAAALLMYPTITNTLITTWSGDRATVFFGGFLALLIGTPLLLLHNVWDGTWRTLVTILVWLTFLKGVVRILLPDMVVTWSMMLATRPRMLRALLVLMLCIGLYLIYIGFGF